MRTSLRDACAAGGIDPENGTFLCMNQNVSLTQAIRRLRQQRHHGFPQIGSLRNDVSHHYFSLLATTIKTGDQDERSIAVQIKESQNDELGARALIGM